MEKQLHTTAEKKMNKEIKPVENTKARIRIKPKGGLWTSSYIEGTSDWNEFLKSDGGISKTADEGFILTPKEGVKVYHLTQDNIEEFVNEYIHEYKDPLEELFGWGFRQSYYIDFERLATEYDGFHMDPNAIQSPYMLDYELVLWDVESTVWFRWCFEDNIERFDIKVKGI